VISAVPGGSRRLPDRVRGCGALALRASGLPHVSELTPLPDTLQSLLAADLPALETIGHAGGGNPLPEDLEDLAVMRCASLADVSRVSWAGCARLRRVQITECGLTSGLHASIMEAPLLQELDLRDNALERVVSDATAEAAGAADSGALSMVAGACAAAAEGLPSLRRLLLQGNRLGSIPGRLLAVSASLRVLDVSHNPVVSLPDEIGRCSLLRELNASHTALAALPAALGSLSMLETLDVTGTRSLRELGPCLAGCVALRRLLAPGSGVEVVDECVGGLPDLVELDLAGCPLYGERDDSFGRDILQLATKEARRAVEAEGALRPTDARGAAAGLWSSATVRVAAPGDQLAASGSAGGVGTQGGAAPAGAAGRARTDGPRDPCAPAPTSLDSLETSGGGPEAPLRVEERGAARADLRETFRSTRPAGEEAMLAKGKAVSVPVAGWGWAAGRPGE